MKFLSFIAYFDYLSNEVKLTISNRDTRLKTFTGGLLSIISASVLIVLALYFFIELLQKDNIYVSSSMEYSHDSNLTDSNSFPFLIRLTDKNNKPFANPESIYSVSLKYWYNDNPGNQLIGQNNANIQVESCDINKHFGHYRQLFSNITDLSTFYCVVPRPSNMSIHGKYGDIYPFGYYHFYVTMCNGQDTCLDKDTLHQITQNVYMDFRTVDFSMNTENKEVKSPSIHTDRHALSSTVYKRIWFYLDPIKYITDDGFFLVSESTELFTKYDTMKYDVDLRDIYIGTIPGTFATMTILNTGTVYIYNRKYAKMQDYLASIGGMITFVQILANILNYIFAKNSYHLEYINRMSMLKEMINTSKIDKTNRVLSEDKNSFSPIRITKHLNTNQHNLQREPYMDKKSELNSFRLKKDSDLLIKLNKWYNRIIPFQTYPKQQALLLDKCIGRICEYLNIINILTKIEDNHILMKEAYPLMKRNKQEREHQLLNIISSNKLYSTLNNNIKY